VPGFPALCGAVVPAGSNILLVRMPTMGSLVGFGFERIFRRTGT
jgi:hypothetical protein